MNMNVVILATPKQFSGISLGMTTLLRIIGSAMGPALAGMYMQTHQTAINVSNTIRYFRSLASFNDIRNCSNSFDCINGSSNNS
jgi:hypothetical protein